MAIFNGFDLRSFPDDAAIRFGRIEVGDVEIPGVERKIMGSYEIYRRGSLDKLGITCIQDQVPKLFEETLTPTSQGQTPLASRLSMMNIQLTLSSGR